MFWEQKFTRGKYRAFISRGKEATTPAFKKHLDFLLKTYGKPIHVVNLLSSKEAQEKEIIDGYEEQLKPYRTGPINAAPYNSFDMHSIIGKSGTNFKAFGTELLDVLQPDLLKIGLFSKFNDKVIANQDGVFRTNCLDCLDRYSEHSNNIDIYL